MPASPLPLFSAFITPQPLESGICSFRTDALVGLWGLGTEFVLGRPSSRLPTADEQTLQGQWAVLHPVHLRVHVGFQFGHRPFLSSCHMALAGQLQWEEDDKCIFRFLF